MQAIQPRSTAHQACEHALRRAVLTGELAPGQRLPPERTLAETLGVSRLTLRAALAALTAQGILAVRHGSGYVVQDVTRTGGGDLLVDLAELATEQDGLGAIAAELLRVRRHLAHAVLEHLVEHPPKAAGLRAFDAAVEAMAERVAASAARGAARGADLDAIVAADLVVAAALLDATSSPVLPLCLNPVSDVLARSPQLRAAMFAEPAGNVAGWRAVGQWLRKPVRADAIIAVLAARDTATLARLARRRSSR